MKITNIYRFVQDILELFNYHILVKIGEWHLNNT